MWTVGLHGACIRVPMGGAQRLKQASSSSDPLPTGVGGRGGKSHTALFIWLQPLPSSYNQRFSTTPWWSMENIYRRPTALRRNNSGAAHIVWECVSDINGVFVIPEKSSCGKLFRRNGVKRRDTFHLRRHYWLLLAISTIIVRMCSISRYPAEKKKKNTTGNQGFVFLQQWHVESCYFESWERFPIVNTSCFFFFSFLIQGWIFFFFKRKQAPSTQAKCQHEQFPCSLSRNTHPVRACVLSISQAELQWRGCDGEATCLHRAGSVR